MLFIELFINIKNTMEIISHYFTILKHKFKKLSEKSWDLRRYFYFIGLIVVYFPSFISELFSFHILKFIGILLIFGIILFHLVCLYKPILESKSNALLHYTLPVFFLKNYYKIR